mgnify:CR=1 FL=1
MAISGSRERYRGISSTGMNRENIAQHLARSVLFKEATANEIETFAEVARVQIISEGEYVYQKGDPSDVFYVIAMGEAELLLDGEGGSPRVVGRIGPGGHFGETGILAGKTRALSIRALCDLVVICFDKRYFRIAILSNNRIHKQLDMALAERLRVAFYDQAEGGDEDRSPQQMSEAEDVILFREKNLSAIQLRRKKRKKKDDLRESKAAKRTQAIIERYASNSTPFILSGESGTGKSIIARQIHLQSGQRQGQYREVDLRDFEPGQFERKLFGTEQSAFPFAQARQAGLLEQTSGGTIVFTHIHLMKEELQEKLVRILDSSTYYHVDSAKPLAMQSRVVFITNFTLEYLKNTDKVIPRLLAFFERQHFEVPPLRQHKEDIPRLVSHYLERYSKEYVKNIKKVTPETLGIFMNYDWPGNLTELSSVIRRAVMLAQKDEIIPDQILLGLPKTEGKWEYNILRIAWIRKLLNSRLFPALPQAIVGSVLLITILFLFFGPANAESNLGLTIAWYIGWPLMFFSFFFLSRTWCSVCSLAVPGTLLQNIVKPTRNTPLFIKNYSGWIMAGLCILVFWVEIVWNAYDSPWLTGGIILVITLGSVLFSVLFARRSWCRYLCPLGAVNAIFSMPSVVELRSNRHVCLNRCQSHTCFRGEADREGCPMFRHPYLVDNNRDCIMCAKCIKNCENSSIQLNLRLAPQELWDEENPRRADLFFIVAMGAIFFPFALLQDFTLFATWLADLCGSLGWQPPYAVAASALFFLNILVFQLGYSLMVWIQSRYVKMDRKMLLPLFGYGFIPLILGGFMSLHLEFFVRGAGRIIRNIKELFGLHPNYEQIRLISEDSTYVLQVLTIFGALLASLYATYRVIERVMQGEAVTSRAVLFPFSFLFVLAGLYVFIV